MYIKRVHNIATGQIELIEITAHQMMCDRLGLPYNTPEQTVLDQFNALKQTSEDEQAKLVRLNTIIDNTLARMHVYNPQATNDLISQAKFGLALIEIHKLVNDLRLNILAKSHLED